MRGLTRRLAERREIRDPRLKAALWRKDGVAIQVEASLRLLRHGARQAWLLSCADRTVSRRLEEALRRQTELLRRTFDSLSDAVIIMDCQRPPMILDCNEGAVRVFGYRRGELVGKTIRLLCRDDQAIRDFHGKLEADFAADSQVCVVPEFQSRRKDGTTFVSEHRVTALTDWDGRQVGWVNIVRDITHGLRFERAFQESESKFRELSDQSPNLIFIDRGGQLVYANRRCEEALGYTSEELRAAEFDFMMLLAPESREDFIEGSRRLGHGIQVAPIQCVLLTKGGRRIPVLLSAKRITFDGLSSILGVATDITERERLESALAQSEVRFRTLFENLNTCVAVYEAVDGGEDFIIRDFNQAAERAEKVSRADLIGRRVTEAFPGVVRFGILEVFQDVWRTGKPRHFPVGLYKDERISGWRENFIYRLPNGEVVAVYEDVSQRKEAERILRENEGKLSALLGAITDPMCMMDRDLNIVWANEVALRQCGRDIIGKKCYEAFHGRCSPWSDCCAPRSLKDGEVHEAEILVQDREGTPRWVHCMSSVAIRDEAGRPSAVLEISRDITERKRAESDRLRSQKMESLGLFAGGIAHDFNNMLTAILGNLTYLRWGLADQPQLRAALSDAEEAARRAGGIARQLLTFTKGGVPLKRETDLGRLARDSAGLVLKGSKIRCDFSLPEDLWGVEADPTQLSQVIGNLVLNAIQAMPGGGRMEISAANEPGETPRVRLSVRDHGEGIPQENLAKVFDPYFTTRQRGSGLGLTMAFRILQQHGGSLSVESRSGKGAVFELVLPALGRVPVPAQEGAPAPVRGTGRILVMDDEQIVREVLTRLLESLGYRVVSVADGAEAVKAHHKALAAKKPFDAAVLDLTVPGGMGGLEALAAMRRAEPAATPTTRP